ncbi:fumarate reductase/succinate dehydrogenase flavoprotein subunit [Mycolicibacterium litorale]|uniref:Succinate dehydrogenase, flavoprotein subunit n=1 Tax=Mycolicibacterium litorale TaxID=758802 RepID=A0AAD1IPI8_9MYCO|nr:fumarate reductase/succinate dehydrogenase flavoprotein subunit [Mycolicibacterium litorale]MCV7417107.1 fumarate reductase/succinate dehydrogenase flavoprotein subunit [Mycolicibacterium litorale]TDY04895.1 succinate dehydrogenase / fumarate reductase flavoprotein subunit [Mycolicibacterium litorale]BBY18323.1 putative succinate dehydrogenase, flavoprotein subunit [Mycolicibacterium litorale]
MAATDPRPNDSSGIERHQYDVVVIGAGGAGLRAVIEARERGLRVAVVCKSLFGKAHTVMAEGGCAASMGNTNPKDSWQVHFGDTMRGGKFLNNWRMAELHAKEAPDRVWELETYGALFDRTKDGRISQRNFGGHTYPRLAHVGDRTGLEIIRTMQQKIVSLQQEDKAELGDYDARIRVFAECTVTDLILDETSGEKRVAGAFGYWRESGRFILFEAPAVVLATGGIGKSYKVTSNSWEYTGDGHALALRAGATLINMEFIQFHPTGMVWPPSVKGILVTEGVRGDGGVLKNSDGKRFMFDYIPDVFKGQYAESEDEADQWLKDNDSARRTPDLLPRDEVARAINTEVKEGRGTPHGGVYLDIASRMSSEEIKRRLPSMYHQFMELAEVDITTDEMEVGPTCHYVMGGIEVDPDTGAAKTAGLFAAGECAGGMHGSNRLGGNSLSDLLVFGRRAGLGASDYVRALSDRPTVSEEAIEAACRLALAPFDGPSEGEPENPYTVQLDLQDTMNELVGIIRKADEITEAQTKLDELRERFKRLKVEGNRHFNPGWHLAIDLRNMLLVSECVAKAALERTESRGGHTRDDYPAMEAKWRKTLLVCRAVNDGAGDSVVPSVTVTQEDQVPMRDDLLELLDIEELEKYFTDDELANHPARRSS